MKISAFFLVITFTHTLVSMNENTEVSTPKTELTSISLSGIVARNKRGYLLCSISRHLKRHEDQPEYTGTVNNRGYDPDKWYSAQLGQQEAQQYYQQLLQELLVTQVATSQQQK